MRQACLLFSCLLLTFLLNRCGHQQAHNRIYLEADSILRLTTEMQAWIGSPEIQRMHDFEEEINSDLAALNPISSNDSSIILYRDLYNGLGQCVKSCNEFHEETFLLESSLREIIEEVQIKEADLKKLQASLLYEVDNYNDLYSRIDSSMGLAIRQAEIFYALKPEIDKIIEQSRKGD